MLTTYLVSCLFLCIAEGTSRPPPAVNHKLVFDNETKKIILETHNNYRKVSNVPGLKWDDEYASLAQTYSKKCLFEHTKNDWGENLFMGKFADKNDIVNAIHMWYNEVCYYNFSISKFSFATGHFTQMVWRDTKVLGCGYTYCSNGVKPFGSIKSGLFICYYYPPGNVLTKFNLNVKKPSKMPNCNTGIINWSG